MSKRHQKVLYREKVALTSTDHRIGRWRLVLECGHEVVRVGSDSDIKRRESAVCLLCHEAALRDTAPKDSYRPNKRLAVEDVRFIRASPSSVVRMAEVFGVSPGHVSQIRKRRTWRGV